MRSVLRGQRDAITRCYEQTLMREPLLEGTIELVVSVDARGSVSNVSTSGTLQSAAVDECIRGAIQPLCFPPPHNGVVQLNYPLTFRRGR
jgi:outer membrane biosynthesis protein TonB